MVREGRREIYNGQRLPQEKRLRASDAQTAVAEMENIFTLFAEDGKKDDFIQFVKKSVC